EIPVAVFAPEETIERLRRFVEAVLGERGGNFANGLVQLEQNPFIIGGQKQAFYFSLHLAALHLAETAGVPEFVAKVASEFDILLIEHHILAEWRAAHRAESNCVRPIFGNEVEGVGRVPKTLAHLATDFVA